MYIAFIEIQNFRKLKACRVEFAKNKTIFVGANNSGKTSAMDALTLFLKKSRRDDFATIDFTLSNWPRLNQVGEQWINTTDDIGPDISVKNLLHLLPAIDVWLKAEENDLHRVAHLLPTLDWNTDELIGIRLIFAPKDMEQLYKDFRNAHESARNTEGVSKNKNTKLRLWPKSLRDFLDRELRRQFKVQSYILDFTKLNSPVKGEIQPQPLPENSDPLAHDPFDGLVKIDSIGAQRGFSDPKTNNETHSGFASLSAQLRSYFLRHLNPSESPDPSDIEALEAIEEAKLVFNEKLRESFNSAIRELQELNYPGFSDPKISVISKIEPNDGLDHESMVQFELPGYDSLSLPEKYNGLGYQNLISMAFHLIRFRDEWMRVGKAAKDQSTPDEIELLHIVLVEEPEAHLHAQVQQVFIRKAYEFLRNHEKLKNDFSVFSTQMIVSTHSSHIAHESDFACLRYFRREPVMATGEIPTVKVINLSKTFGDQDKTSKFVTRYLKATHCDLFFADAVILIEGSAERMLIPHFIREGFPELNQSYISLLEIGGAHAHRLKPLLDTLGLLSLIVTDLDSTNESNRSVHPERGQNFKTGNTTLKKWVPKKELIDELLDMPDDAKQTDEGLIRVAYQCPISVEYQMGESQSEAIPYTFEDSLALTNLELFREYAQPVGLIKKFQNALSEENLSCACKEMFSSLKSNSKAKMALDMLYITEPSKILPPEYIDEGLKWLNNKLEDRMSEDMLEEKANVENV